MKHYLFPLLVTLVFALSSPVGFAQHMVKGTDISKVEYDVFRDPPGEFRGVRWMSYPLSRLSDSLMKAQIMRTVEGKLWGTYLLGPGGGPTTELSADYIRESRREPSDAGVPYLSKEYFRIYRNTIEEGVRHGLHMSTLYDEWMYPSGVVGGLFYSRHPEDAAKSLDMVEADVEGSAQTVKLTLPEGCSYVGAVLMNMKTLERTDVSDSFRRGVLTCDIPAGEWKVMLFCLNPEFRPRSWKGGFVDYLDREAVAKYIKLNFDPYWENLKDLFGTVIRRTIYDEPCMHLTGGRMWTPKFNEGFRERYGYSPMTLYPALWYNIGPETASARNALYGYRTELFAENYIGQVAAWCEERGIDYSGHLDQEESRNPVAISGDLMKAFKHQQTPGIDDIYYAGRTNVAYKIISSAAYNYDRPEFIAETYAAYRKMNDTVAMRVALDQLSMGVNIQLAVAGKTPQMDAMLGRSGYLLRAGRHVADIGVIYPIAALQAAYSFSGPAGPNESSNTHYGYEGGIVPPEIDYMDLGETLFRGLRVDYTYLHPEIVVEKCRVDGNRFVMENTMNREEFRVIILPGGDTFPAETAKKIVEFYRAGGVVIATSKLPSKSSERGRDREIADMVYEVFGVSDRYPMTNNITLVTDRFTSFFTNTNPAGGRGYFVPQPYTDVLATILNQVIPVRDVAFDLPADQYVKMTVDYEGGLTYLHKVKEGRDIYFVVNSTNHPVDTRVTLRGRKNLSTWDPHTGERIPTITVYGEAHGVEVTEIPVRFNPLTSVFFISD